MKILELQNRKGIVLDIQFSAIYIVLLYIVPWKQVTPCEQALDESEREKQPFNRKKHLAEVDNDATFFLNRNFIKGHEQG